MIMKVCILCILTMLYQVNGDACLPELSFSVNDIYEAQESYIICEVNGACAEVLVTFKKKVNEVFEVALIGNTTDHKGYTLSNDVAYDTDRVDWSPFDPLYRMRLTRSILKDNGVWKCETQTAVSEELRFNVFSIYENVFVSVESPSYILLDTLHVYKCTSKEVYPDLKVIWNINGINRTDVGEEDNSFNGDVFNITNTYENTLDRHDTYDVICFIEQNDGQNPWSKAAPAITPPIFAPPTIEDIKYSEKTHVTPSDDLWMTCTVSGTNHEIIWIHEDGTVDPALFNSTIKWEFDDFKYGERNATNSSLYWTVLPSEQSCDFLDRYNGNYKCIGKAEKGDPQESESKNFVVQYAPILMNPNDEVIYASIGETKTIECEVKCASPSSVTYEWTSEKNGGIINHENWTIEVVVTEEYFNDTLKCLVTNLIETTEKIFVFKEIKVTSTGEPELDTTTASESITTSVPDDPGNPNQALVIAFAVIWSLCGVFAILVVCLAIYHYKQVQNGKNYRSEYSEEIILTEDEATPGTSHGFGVYDDIHPAADGGDAMSGTISGVTNEGLYADVQVKAQTQMPVAPKRASKVKATMSHPDTMKIIHTQAPAASKSPMIARHQPYLSSTNKCHEPTTDNTPVNRRNQIPSQHSNELSTGTVSKVEQVQRRQESPNKIAALKQSTNGVRPSIPFKPNITAVRSSRSSAAGALYDNPDVNLYANCDQRPTQKNADGTLTYADLDLQKEDPYHEGAPPVPAKIMTDQEPVQYASIKHG